MPKPTFIVSDQSKNCYQFIILTSGINLDAFKKNPIMLYNHVNDDEPEDAIGVWENIRVEGTQLLADAVIDDKEEFAKRVLDKVERGIIKAASVGFNFEYDDIVLGYNGFEDVPVITKCVLKEISICPVPGNGNAVRLYANGEELTTEKLSAVLNDKTKPQIKPDNMKKIQLFAAALSIAFTDSMSEDHVLEAVKNKVSECETLKGEITKLKGQIDAAAEKEVSDLIEEAVKKGKLKADQKDTYMKLAKADLASTRSIIEGMPVHTSVLSQLNNTESKDSKFAKLTFKELQKDHPTELARIRQEDPTRYAELLKEAGFNK